MFDGESFNGCFYAEELDFGDEYSSVKSSKKSFKCVGTYYHWPLFKDWEDHKIVHQTEKAILFEVPAGRFWVPKALMKGLRVHKSFIRKYI